jgi:hypothetical protein
VTSRFFTKDTNQGLPDGFLCGESAQCKVRYFPLFPSFRLSAISALKKNAHTVRLFLVRTKNRHLHHGGPSIIMDRVWYEYQSCRFTRNT